jgi:hypothetical protein
LDICRMKLLQSVRQVIVKIHNFYVEVFVFSK